jgi:hypothetical protein
MPIAQAHPEFSPERLRQLRRSQAGVFSFAFIQPLAHRRIHLDAMSIAAIYQRFHAAACLVIFLLHPGQSFGIHPHIQLLADLFQWRDWAISLGRKNNPSRELNRARM